jgi:hypothetical protein
MIEDVREIPIVGGVVAIVVDVVAFGGDLLIKLSLSMGDVIPILSMVSAYVAPQVAWIPKGTVSTLLMVAALLYIGVLVARLFVSR